MHQTAKAYTYGLQLIIQKQQQRQQQRRQQQQQLDRQALLEAKYCPRVAAVSRTQKQKKTHVTFTFDR